ncbi:protein FRG2-like [Elephas maximus indicus]|uniref:protein FRG2-like n=1 Tax=Elephas maximus indicus TaxID=99487 RepID=UPI002115DFB5|nr:protein FRG2-like [Elephas maximus indicus]
MNSWSPPSHLDFTNQSLLQYKVLTTPALESLPHSLKEKGSDKEEKLFEGKGKTLSSEPNESSTERQGVSPLISRKKDEKGPDAGDETQSTHHGKHSKTHSKRRKRPRAWSPGDQPPPLRRCLVTSLRALSEAIYQDVAQVQAQQAQAPLTWEELEVLAQLRGQLYTATQTFYTMATEAAYVFPAEGWLNPDPLPGSRDPAQD